MTRARPRLEVWITGGGTREPLDAVRWIGNVSTGRMALELARTAAARGHRVTLFLADHVAAPPRLRSPRASRIVRFVTSRDLARALAAAAPAPDAIVHAAAVSDYAPVAQRGKVASGRAGWRVELRPLPKVVAAVRRRHRAAVLCTFKLESRITVAELHARAGKSARNAGAELVFANRLEEVGAAHRGWLLDPASGAATESRSRAAAARRIMAACERIAAARTRGRVRGEAPKREGDR